MDKTIVCKDCGAEFVFTEREQAFYESKQFSDPVRCKACRVPGVDTDTIATSQRTAPVR